MEDAVASPRRERRNDHSWRSDLKSPREDETRRRFRLDFKKSCRMLDAKSLEGWQQQECPKNGSPFAPTWGEFETQAPRQEMYNRNMAQMSGCPQKRLQRVCTSEIEPSLFPPSSPVSTSSAASSSFDLELVKHDRLMRGNWEASSATSSASINTQYFDMSAGDFDELETEFFPEDRPVMASS